MVLELTQDEQHLLKEVLESDLADLRMEIRETDDRAFKDTLKKKQEVMEKILAGLQ